MKYAGFSRRIQGLKIHALIDGRRMSKFTRAGSQCDGIQIYTHKGHVRKCFLVLEEYRSWFMNHKLGNISYFSIISYFSPFP
ncbi:hypothetical protein EYC80_003883 [Monilinia laxa]|uniref:Uncharacterized protein n=1 Tax=Monilinia laxa TaxID=61186 RepID=A0A5N6KL41_MONLA|nr:hypothetical protein EYC80_003883 [Monilinia laxa]